MGADQRLEPFVLVKVVGEDRFVARVNELAGKGYEPRGGLVVMSVEHPLTGEGAFVFLLPMFRPAATLRVVS